MKILKKSIDTIYKFITAIWLFFVLSATVSAQSTKVKGRVIDADTGEGIPFVGMYFKDTQIGVTTDLEGYYILEARDLKSDVLVAFLMGYETKETPVKLNSFNHLDIQLKSTSDLLDASLVKPDDSYVKWILSQVNKNRDRNNPEHIGRFNCNVYNKMELDLTNPEKES